jgi:hypothetical protein
MKNSVVNWHGCENYNMNCNIEDLKKRGFECSSYNNDLAPSYTNKKGNIQVFFIDLNSDEMKAEKMTYKFSVMKLDNHGEYQVHIGTTNSFEEMLKMVKDNEEKQKEEGACEMTIKLKDGVISIEHCEGGNLANWKAEKGDWSEIWKTINKLVKKNNGFSLSLKEKGEN